MSTLPSVFISHGAPDLPIVASPATTFLQTLATQLPCPQAIVCISAHWTTLDPRVNTTAQPETIYDFWGFPPELYQITYPAPGSPRVAQRVVEQLQGAGFTVGTDPLRGLDHGAWNPLVLIYPDAQIPVVQLSVQPQLDPQHHFNIGMALKPLRDEGILIMGSGAATHNLSSYKPGLDAPVPAWVQAFNNWLITAIQEGRIADLLNYRQVAPHAQDNHPTEEHFLPLFVALGAGDLEQRRILHQSYANSVLSMAAFAFG